MWADLSSVYIICDDIVIKTVRSKLTTADLQRLRARGTRPGRPRPAQAAFDTSTATHRPRAIEIDRTANRDGIVIVRGHELALGVVTVIALGIFPQPLLDLFADLTVFRGR